MQSAACPICDRTHDSDVLCIWYLSDRVKELESKLGAVSQRESVTREDAEPIPFGDRNLALSQAAAPSVLPDYWWQAAGTASAMNYPHFARACDLAAAVTEWWSDDENNVGGADYEQRLFNIVTAFVRGEPLPRKKNG